MTLVCTAMPAWPPRAWLARCEGTADALAWVLGLVATRYA